jgi:tetratricopeptide (TPR) repeat protein
MNIDGTNAGLYSHTTALQPCWGCGILPGLGMCKFAMCSICKEKRLPSGVFCSTECLKLNWPRHKKWHKQLEMSQVVSEGRQINPHTGLSDHEAALLRPNDMSIESTKYDELLVAACKHSDLGDFVKGCRALRRAITLEPDRAEAHGVLGNLLSRSGDQDGACKAFCRVMELSDHGSGHWAQAFAAAFNSCNAQLSTAAGRPPWWNSTKLKEFSHLAIAASTEVSYTLCLVARGNALDGSWTGHQGISSQPTAADLREAASFYRKAAQRVSLVSSKERIVKKGVACLKAVAALEENPMLQIAWEDGAVVAMSTGQ